MLPTKRTVWIICTCIKEEYLKDVINKDGQLAQEPFDIMYQVCTTMLQVQRKISVIQKLGVCDYAITETQVDGFRVPDKIRTE